MTENGIGELAKALADAQAEMKNAPLNKVNPHFKSKYADLASIRDAVIPTLAKHGLAVLQTFETTEHGAVLVTTLIHESGASVTSHCPIMTGDKPGPQPFGSATTYARRYSLAAIAGISADEDDDANASQDDAKWHGPLPKTTLVKKVREGMADLEACSDLDEFDACYMTHKAVFEQMEKDMPAEWAGPLDAGTPWKDRMAALREKVGQPKKDAPTITLFWPDGNQRSFERLSDYFDAFKKAVKVNKDVWDLESNQDVLESLVAKKPELQKYVDEIETMAAEDLPVTAAG